MSKVSGVHCGYRKFAVDHDWLRRREEARTQERQQKFAEWSKTWITVTRLKETRLWTDWAIKQWLGEPQKQDKYKVFLVADVKAAERKKAFKEWHAPRLDKKLVTYPHFQIMKL